MGKWKSMGEVFETRAESAQLLVSTGPHWNLDVDSVKKIDRMHLNMSKYLHRMSNEPSLGLFHVQEHIRRTVPKIVTLKKDLDTSNAKVSSMTYDIEDSSKIVNTLKGLESFRNIKKTGARAQELLQQLTFEENQTENTL